MVPACRLRCFTLELVLLAFAPFAAAAQERTQDWPTRPVRVIVPYGPGGIGDLLVRLTTDRLAKIFGQPFVLENRPEAAESSGWNMRRMQPTTATPWRRLGAPSSPSFR